MPRKFFQSSIQELEALLNEPHTSVSLLQALQEELAHRKTERAARLRKRVNDRLSASGIDANSQEPVSRKPPVFPSPLQQSATQSVGDQESLHFQQPSARIRSTSETLRTAV